MSASSLMLGGQKLLTAIQMMNNSLKKIDYSYQLHGPKRGTIGQKLEGFHGDYADDEDLADYDFN